MFCARHRCPTACVLRTKLRLCTAGSQFSSFACRGAAMTHFCTFSLRGLRDCNPKHTYLRLQSFQNRFNLSSNLSYPKP